MKLLILLLLAALPAAAVPLPLVCELTREEVPSIKILLTERTAFSLKGKVASEQEHPGEPSRQDNPTDTEVSGGLSMTGTTRVMEPQCSSRTTSTGTLIDDYHDLQRRTEFCSLGLLLTSGLGTPPRNLVPSGETETS